MSDDLPNQSLHLARRRILDSKFTVSPAAAQVSETVSPWRRLRMAAKTLDELEDVVCGEPSFDSSLVTTCHRLRTKPVDEFSVEDLRIMIGQQIGLSHLVPLAVAILEREPLAEGDYYPGDLITSVIGAVEWLQAQPEWLARVIRATERASAELEEADIDLRQRLAKFLARVRG